MNDRERRRHRVVAPSEHPRRARRPRRHGHDRPAGVEERVHRRHVGRDRRGVPRARATRARGPSCSPARAATSAPAPISAARSAPAAARRRCRRATMIDAMRVLGDVVLAIHDCPVPVVAKVDGLCVGAGLGLALAADLTWCSGPRPLLGDLRQARAQPRLRHVVVAAPAHRRAQGEGARVHREDVQRHRGVRARARQRGRAGRRARRRRRTRSSTRSRPVRRSRSSTTKRELDNASTSSLAQALEIEALAQSVNVQTDDLREALTRTWNAARRRSRAGRRGRWRDDGPERLGRRSSTTSTQRRADVARDGRRGAAARSTATRASSTSARASTTCSTPGRSRSSARSSAATDAPGRRGRHGLGSHRRPAGDGRGRGLHGEGRHDQPAGELEALPRRRARGRRPRAAGHDARGRRASAPTGKATARDADRHARPGALLGPRAARHRGARRVGRARRARRADVRLHGDERSTASIFTAGPPVVFESLGETITKEDLGGPGVAIASGLIHNVADRRRGRARPRARLPPLLPVVGVVVPARRRDGDDARRGSSPRSSTSCRATVGASTTCAT